MRPIGALITGLVLMTGCAVSTSDLPTNLESPESIRDIGVNIGGATDPTEDWPPRGIVLEVGEQAWMLPPGLGGGTVFASSLTSLQVRVLWAGSCSLVTSFIAKPSGLYEVRVPAEGSATVMDRTDEAIAMGPSIGEASVSPCP
jgi:hypothetical protein